MRVTGSPGALVDLSVPPGSGTVSPSRVSLDDAGTAEARVRAGAPGILSVSAAMSTPLLQRATRLPGWVVPQSQLLLRPGLLTVQAERRVVQCRAGALRPPAGETPGGGREKPTKPSAAAQGIPADSAKLGMRVDAPDTARAGGLLVWRIRSPTGAPGGPERAGRSAPGRRRGGARCIGAPGDGLDRPRRVRALAPGDRSRPLGGGPHPAGPRLAAGERYPEHDSPRCGPAGSRACAPPTRSRCARRAVAAG